MFHEFLTNVGLYHTGNDLQDYKERQIFMTLLNLQWLANFWTLKHWAIVISTVYYGWGAKDTMSHATPFLGITVARMTRDSFFKTLTLNHVESFHSLLASRQSGLMVWDNFQRGQKLSEQCGGRSSKFLIGIVEAAHRVVPFLDRFGFSNEKWNDCNMLMTYDRTWLHPSPLSMQSYESIDPYSSTFGTDMFVDHDRIDVSSQLCFSGDCVWSYENVLNLRKYICNMSHAFTRLFECNKIGVIADHIGKFNEYCNEIGSIADYIGKFNKYCSAADSLQFINAAYKLQRKAVLNWNATADNVTMSFNIGFIGIQEDSAATRHATEVWLVKI